MGFNWCWHRPGRSLRGITTCRHCGVAVEECPCGPQKRSNDPCRCCEGSGWVAILRSRAETMRQTIPIGLA